MSNMMKAPVAIKNAVRKEVEKGYRPTSVTTTLRAPTVPGVAELLDDSGGRFFRRQQVVNAAADWKLRNPDHRISNRFASGSEQAEEALQYLDSANYLTKTVSVIRPDGVLSQGFAFARPNAIDLLLHHGYLTMMDSTYHSCKLEWFLYTLMVRDSCGNWMPGAHFLTEYEDSYVLVECLRAAKQWCGDAGGWQPRHFMTDDSAMEQRAVRESFRGLIDGEQVVTYLLCIFHKERTFKRKFPPKAYPKVSYNLRKVYTAIVTIPQIYKSLIAALKYWRTEPGARDSVREAYNACKTNAQRNYIKAECIDTLPLWAACFRMHSTVLLQTRSTSHVEAWHAQLKNSNGVTKQILHQFSLAGLCKHITSVDDSYFTRAEAARINFRSKTSAFCAKYPQLSVFPSPVQKLIEPEIRKAEE